MQNNNKRERILDAMQELMRTASRQPFPSAILPKKQESGKEVFITISL